jgi:hypothetical protein
VSVLVEDESTTGRKGTSNVSKRSARCACCSVRLLERVRVGSIPGLSTVQM